MEKQARPRLAVRYLDKRLIDRDGQDKIIIRLCDRA